MERCMVVLASMFLMTFAYGMLFVFGSFFTAMLEEYQENRSSTATVQALFIGVGLTSGVFSGMLIARYGVRKVSCIGAFLVPFGFMITYFAETIVVPDVTIGVIAGFGVSLLQISSLTAASKSFTGSQRSLVLAVQNACMSLGGIVLPFFINFLLKQYKLRETFLILGALYLNCIPAAIILSARISRKGTARVSAKPETGDENTQQQQVKAKPSLTHMFKQLYCDFKSIVTVPYSLQITAVGLTVATLDGYMTLILDIFKWKGLSSDNAILALTIANVAGFLARLIPGLVKQLPGISSYIAPVCFTAFGVAGQITMYTASSLTVNFIGCCIIGLAAGGLSASGYIIVAKYSEDDKLSLSLGLALSAIGISVVVTGPSFGAIFDTYRSYDAVHFIIIAIQCVAAVLLLMSYGMRRRIRLALKKQRTRSITVFDFDNISTAQDGSQIK